MPAALYISAVAIGVSPRPIALLQVDMDANAERLFVIYRATFDVYAVLGRPPGGIAKLQLPLRFGSSDELLVGILDDNRNYNVKAADGVRCELVQSTVDMTQ